MAQFPIDIKIDTSDASKLGPLNRQLNETDKAATGAAAATRALTAAVATIASAAAVGQVVRLSDSYTKIQNSIVNVVNSTQELTQRTGELLRVANQSRSSFEATAALYGKLKRATDELGISQDRVLRITDLINKGFIASGATGQEAANAVTQLAQGLASGALRGDEFNSVAEQAPVILRAVSQETGKTIGQLREFAATGGITADILIRSIEGYAATIDREFSRTAVTFDQQATVARNLATEWVGTSDSIRQASAAAGAVLVTLAENLDTVVNAAEILAVLYGTKLIGQIIAKRNATLEEIRVEQLAASAAVRRAEVEKALAFNTLETKRAKLASTVANVQNARSTALETESIARLIPLLNAQTRAQGSVAVATGAAARAAEAATAANARLTAANGAAAATGALATATRGLSSAMALLGGPAGVAILAGSALLYFADSTAEAGKQARDSQINSELERLVKNYGELTQIGQRKAVGDLTQQQIDLNQQLIEANRLLDESKQKAEAANSARGQSFVGGDVNASAQVAAASARVLELKTALDATQKQLETLFQSRAPDAEGWVKPKNSAATIAFYDELTTKLQQQIALIGLTEVEQARLQARQELLNKAQKEGVTLTEAQITAYSNLAAQAVVEQQRAEADKYILTLGRQVAAEKDVGVQAQINANLARLSTGATAEQRAAVEALTRSLYAQQEAERSAAELNTVRQIGVTVEDPLAKLETELQDKRDLLFNAYYEEQISFEEHQQRLLNLEKDYNKQRAEAQFQLQQGRINAERAQQAQLLGITSSIFDQLADKIEESKGKESAAYKAAFIASKAAAIAQAVIQTELAATTALAPPPFGLGPVAGLPYSQVIRGLGYTSIGLMAAQAVTGFANGGYVSGPGTGRSDSIPAYLSNGEYVMPAASTDRYRSELDAMRRGTYSGAQPTASGVRVTINNNVSDVASVSVAEGPDGELIATIDRRINERVPGLMAEQATDPYSRFNRSMNNQYRLERR